MQDQLDGAIEEQRAAATADIKARWDQVPASQAYSDATEAVQQAVTRTARSVLDRIQHETQIPAIKNLASQFASSIYPRILDELDAARVAPEPEPPTPGPNPSPGPAPAKQSISINKLTLPGAGQVLETEAAIDGYLDQLRATLLATIHDNKRITL